jgi:hypothetical protein
MHAANKCKHTTPSRRADAIKSLKKETNGDGEEEEEEGKNPPHYRS